MIIPTVKYSKHKMVWGCFSWNAMGRLVEVHGNMDKFQYINILENNLAASVKMMKMKDFILQMDNDPKHTSKYAKESYKKNKWKLLEWPS